MKIIAYFLFFSQILFLGCKPTKEIALKELAFSKVEKNPTKSTELINLRNDIIWSIVFSKPIMIYKENNSDYLLFQNRQDSLILYSLNNNKKKKFYFPKSRWHIFTNPSIILSLNSDDDRMQYILQYSIINTDTIHYNKKIELTNKLHYNKTKVSICMSHLGANTILHDSIFISSYRIMSLKDNFIGKSVFVSYNKELTKIQYIGTYPKKFKKEKTRNQEPVFSMLTDSTLVYSFLNSNEISKVNIFTGKEEQRVSFSNDSTFMKYDHSKDKNLAYIDRYIKQNEANLQVLVDSSKNIIIFKRNRLYSKSERPTHTCFVMDYNFTPKYKFDLPEGAVPKLSCTYNKGFLIVNSKKISLDYYETN